MTYLLGDFCGVCELLVWSYYKKAIYPLLGKIGLAKFLEVFNTALSRVKISKPYL